MKIIGHYHITRKQQRYFDRLIARHYDIPTLARIADRDSDAPVKLSRLKAERFNWYCQITSTFI